MPSKKCFSVSNKFPFPKACWSASFLDQIIHEKRTPGVYGLQDWMASHTNTDTMIKKTSMTLMGT